MQFSDEQTVGEHPRLTGDGLFSNGLADGVTGYSQGWFKFKILFGNMEGGKPPPVRQAQYPPGVLCTGEAGQSIREISLLRIVGRGKDNRTAGTCSFVKVLSMFLSDKCRKSERVYGLLNISQCPTLSEDC